MEGRTTWYNTGGYYISTNKCRHSCLDVVKPFLSSHFCFFLLLEHRFFGPIIANNIYLGANYLSFNDFDWI